MPHGLNNWRFIDVKNFLSGHHFVLSHVEGSHYFYVGTFEGKVRQVCVPFYGAKSLHPKTMKNIIVQSGIPQKTWTT
jgi:predicted RNA binding protein YcfA (HicA-like mRNA interferase family)